MTKQKEFWWHFKPLDTLFIRDGAPFQAGEGGLRGHVSLFPPPINTCQGAIRTALAYGQGWTPNSGTDFPEELGNSENIGKLKFKGPYIFKEELLFPVPLHIVAKEKPDNITYYYLEPIAKYKCDLKSNDHIYLPGLKNNIPGVKPVTGWVNRDDMTKVLSGNLDNITVYKANDLWTTENRVGIIINRETGSAEEHMLYSTFHIRVKKDVAIAVSVGGVPESWHKNVRSHINFGGEGRVASIEQNINNNDYLPALPKLKNQNGKIFFTVSLLTPGYFGQETKDVVLEGPTLKDIKANIITACLGKITQVGGWDIVNKEPRELIPLIPAGSTWFFEADEKHMADIQKLHGSSIGYETKMGYGQIVIGSWEGI